MSVGLSVCPFPYCFEYIFLAARGQIDLKFGRDLQVDLVFLLPDLLPFFLLSSSSSFSSGFKFIFMYKWKQYMEGEEMTTMSLSPGASLY
jgi:hypothetical protein